MSLVVTPNPDGSVTVACGSESVIVAPKQASGSVSGAGGTGSSPTPSQWPVVTPVSGGFTANIWADAHHGPIFEHALGDVESLASLLRDAAPEVGPALFRVTWTSKSSVPIDAISETLRNLDDSDRLRCDIHFSPSDE